MKTLADPEVKRFLKKNFSVLAFHNQMPELYCSTSVDPGNYPEEMVENCSEGAGGGNVRSFICSRDGRVISVTLGYWKKEKFIREMQHTFVMYDRETERVHPMWIDRHKELRKKETEPYRIAVQSLLIRSHEESLRDLGKPIRKVLRTIEEEIYTKGAIG